MRAPRFLFGVAALLALATLGLDAQEKKPVAEKHDSQALVDALREVINTGADLFNVHGDYAGCYRVYQGALMAIKPFLTPELRTKIDKAITKAEQMPRFSDRAFELREVIDEIRAKSKGTAAPEKVVAPKETSSDAKDQKKTVAAGTTGVTGKVTLEGNAAPPGFITFVGTDKRRFSASITDGHYTFKTPIPPGRYRIAIERVPGAKIPAKLDIPERFRNEETSGISIEVRAGKNELDFDLRK